MQEQLVKARASERKRRKEEVRMNVPTPQTPVASTSQALVTSTSTLQTLSPSASPPASSANISSAKKMKLLFSGESKEDAHNDEFVLMRKSL